MIKHIYVAGIGDTKEKAALAFLDDFSKKMPDEVGGYEVFIRAPLIEAEQNDFPRDDKFYSYYMRLSYEKKYIDKTGKIGV